MRDNKRADAAQLLQGLVREYPRNYLYAQELTRLQSGIATP